MTKASIKALLGGTAVAVIAAVALAPSAEAACFWNGYGWNCAAPPAYAAPFWAPYGYAPRDEYNDGNYNQIPNDYPGPATTGGGY